MAKKINVKGKRGMDVLVDRKKRSTPTRVSSEEKPTVVFEISLKTILIVLGIIGAIYLGSRLIEVFVMIFFGFIISSAALPAVRWMREKGLHKGLSVFLVYLLGTLIVSAILYLVLVPSFNEASDLAERLPDFATTLADKLSGISILGRTINEQSVLDAINRMVTSIENDFATVGSSAVQTLATVGGGFLNVLFAIFLSIFMVADHDNFVDLVLLRFTDDERRTRVRKLVIDVENKLGRWLLGQSLLSMIIGAMVWGFLTVMDMPFALPLALFAGLLESIPNLGPIISSIPAIILGFLVGGVWGGVLVAVGYIIIQQVENTLIVPKIIGGVVGLKPIVVLIGVTAGYQLAGPIGALLAVPVMALLEICYEFYVDLQKLKAKGMV